MPVNNGTLKIFFGHGRQLIPISFDEPHRLKRPLHKQWPTREYHPEEIQEYARKKYNLGWRLAPSDVVIDVDPRNGGLEGLALLLADHQRHDPTIEDLGDVYPMVRTGGGGFHFYGHKDPNVKTRDTVELYGKGVEFKTGGRQVIIPGSTHPSGQPYQFDDFSDYTGPATPLPPWLIAQIVRGQNTVTTQAVDPSSVDLTPVQLARLLAGLPASDYATNEEWFPLMAAAHEATGGSGLEAFVSWSLSDNSFVGHDYIIRSRWNSFQPGRDGNISINTLYKEVVKYGGELPPMSLASSHVDAMPSLPPAAPYVAPLPDAPIIHHTDRNQLDRGIQALTISSLASDVEPLLIQIARLPLLDQETYLAHIHQRTGHSIGALRKTLLSARVAAYVGDDDDNDGVDDTALAVTTHLLNAKYSGGEHLIHSEDQQFWSYEKTHWKPVLPNMVGHVLLKATYQYKNQNPHIRSDIAQVLTASERLLRARQATGVNLNLGCQPVINTLNCEVWLDPYTGYVAPKPHMPASRLTSCLATYFDFHATCPVFNFALQQMFVRQPDCNDIVRHLWEVIGYAIQPEKNLATWVMLHGAGANGKTVVLNVLTALLGKASLNKSLSELDNRNNNHALADLPNRLAVIDEDLNSRTLLPDSMLKKISESKTLTANPKSQPTYEFKNTAIVLFATNEYPRIKDLSHGLRRRAQVFNFSRLFRVHEQDIYLAQRVIDTELSGVLNQALCGLQRLRARGGWDVPQSCNEARDMWLR